MHYIFSILLMMASTTTLQAQTAKGTNKAFEYTITTSASAEQIWAIWTDVNNWHTWDTGLKAATLDGPFQEGSKGKLIPDKGPKSTFKITAYQAGRSYTFRTGLPLGGLYVERILEEKNGKTQFTHKVYFKGIGGRLIAGSLGKRYRGMLPEAMKKIQQLAKN